MVPAGRLAAADDARLQSRTMKVALGGLGAAADDARLQRWGHSAVRVGARVAVFGGYGGAKPKRCGDVLLVDASGAVEEAALAADAAAPAAREQHAAAGWRDGFVAFGGRADPAKPFRDAWTCAVAGDTCAWTAVDAAGDAPPARWAHALLPLPGGDAFLVVGGRDAVGALEGDAWSLMLDGAGTGTWAPVACENGPVHAPACCGATRDGAILVFGGGGGVAARTLEGGAWRAVACDDAAAEQLERDGGAVAATGADGELLLVGGAPRAHAEPCRAPGPTPAPRPELADAAVLRFDGETVALAAAATVDGDGRYPVDAAAAELGDGVLVLGGGVPYLFGPVFGASFAVRFDRAAAAVGADAVSDAATDAGAATDAAAAMDEPSEEATVDPPESPPEPPPASAAEKSAEPAPPAPPPG